MITVKLKYQTTKENKQIILDFMKNQNNVIRYAYNRIKENPSKRSQITNTMNNVFVDSWFKNSAINRARRIYESSKDKKVIFGGKKLFLDRCKNKISKDEFEIKRLMPLISLGEKKWSNRKFKLNIIENNEIIFNPIIRPIRDRIPISINLQLPKLRKNYQKILFKLQILAEQKALPITYELDLEYIYISFDETFLNTQVMVNKIKNRIMSLDLNPNYIGYSIIDWKTEEDYKILTIGMISNKEINDYEFELKKEKVNSNNSRMKYIHNKREFEIFEITKRLVNIATSNNVEIFSIEDLNIKSKKNSKQANYNRLCNNMWCRNKFASNLKKRLVLANIKLIEVKSQYSSFVGNILHREFADPIAASIEINRRAFVAQTTKSYLFPDFKKSIKVISKSLEEFANNKVFVDGLKSWKELYDRIKHLKLKYRVSLNLQKFKVFRLNSKMSKVLLFNYFIPYKLN